MFNVFWQLLFSRSAVERPVNNTWKNYKNLQEKDKVRLWLVIRLEAMETTQGGHPQVPPAKPPDDGQPNEEVPVNGAHVLNEAMSEDTSEDEMPTATAKNGVSLPVKPASDSGGDHMGTPGGGPEVIAQDHVGTRNRGTSKNKRPKSTKLCLLNEAMSAQRSYVCHPSFLRRLS